MTGFSGIQIGSKITGIVRSAYPALKSTLSTLQPYLSDLARLKSVLPLAQISRHLGSAEEFREAGYKIMHAASIPAADLEVAHGVLVRAVERLASMGGNAFGHAAGEVTERVLGTSIMIGGKSVPVFGALFIAAMTAWHSGHHAWHGRRDHAYAELFAGLPDVIGNLLGNLVPVPGAAVAMGEAFRQVAVNFTEPLFGVRAEDAGIVGLAKLAHHHYHHYQATRPVRQQRMGDAEIMREWGPSSPDDVYLMLFPGS